MINGLVQHTTVEESTSIQWVNMFSEASTYAFGVVVTNFVQ